MTPPKTLRDLVLEHIDRTGDSYSQIAQKTGLSKPLIGIIATNAEPRAYRSDSVEKLAQGLRLPVDVVSRAAAASAGMAVEELTTRSGRDDARIVSELLDDLSDEELATLRIMVQALAERRGR